MEVASLFLCVLVMADSSDILTVLASQGVEFLLTAQGKVPLSAIDGKMICLFFSANWCRPCKSFTPQLAQLYDRLRKKLEIVFVSFDRDEKGFHDHLNSIPWLAVPFDANLNKRLSHRYHVHRIPSLVPLGTNGQSVEEDAVALIEDYGVDAFPFTRERREELKDLDNAKREGGNLQQLLAFEGPDYLVSTAYGKITIRSLSGKTIGLYFGAHWCPPCRSFTLQLTEAYNEIIASPTSNQDFEIIFVSTDRDNEEFGLHIAVMPWLSIPFRKSKTRQDLCRIFDIKVIPALVVIGPDGKTVSTRGRTMISLYGANAFPFTESRRAELEAEVRKEVEGMPPEVKDPKHQHVLRLGMAKAFLCDFCRRQGRFWAFSCHVCDYDLHPTCVALDQII